MENLKAEIETLSKEELVDSLLKVADYCKKGRMSTLTDDGDYKSHWFAQGVNCTINGVECTIVESIGKDVFTNKYIHKGDVF